MLRKFLAFGLCIIAFGLFFSLALAQEAQPSSSPQASSVDYRLPYPGILPNHPLYIFKQLRDKILSLLITNQNRKVEFQQLISDKQVNMSVFLIQKGESELGIKTLEQAVGSIEATKKLVEGLPSTRSDEVGNLKVNYGKSLLKYQEVLLALPPLADADLAARLQTVKEKLNSLVTEFNKTNQ